MVSFRRYGVLVALLALGFVANRPVHASDAESYADGQQDFETMIKLTSNGLR